MNYPLVNCHITNWKITMLLMGKPSISMGHGFHSYVTNYQRVTLHTFQHVVRLTFAPSRKAKRRMASMANVTGTAWDHGWSEGWKLEKASTVLDPWSSLKIWNAFKKNTEGFLNKWIKINFGGHVFIASSPPKLVMAKPKLWLRWMLIDRVSADGNIDRVQNYELVLIAGHEKHCNIIYCIHI